MASRPSAPVLIVGLVVAVGAMAMLNNAQYQNRPRTSQEIEAEEAAKSQQNAQQQPKPPQPQGPTAADKLVELGPDTTLGEATAKTSLTIGYHWTPEVQQDPMRVYGPLEMLTKMGKGTVKVRLVNLDVPGAPAVPEGLSGNGKLLVPLRPEGGFDPGTMQRAVGEAMKAGVIPNDTSK